MSRLHLGDEIIVAYADRYAPDQFEALVPGDLGPTQLVAGGGIAARMVSRSRAVRRATDITPVGLIGDERGVPLNVADFALRPVTSPLSRPPTLAVVGTSMNSGKTTTVRFLVNSLARGGHQPGATKVTGTGSGGDYWIMLDAGAHRMLDFTDVGFASTYRVPLPQIERAMIELIDHLTAVGSRSLLLEVADGLYQSETARLLESAVFRSSVDQVVFAAGEAMGAAHGVEHLRRLGLPVCAVSGRLTASPLAAVEAALATGLPVLGIEQLREPATSAALLGLEAAPSLEPAPTQKLAPRNAEADEKTVAIPIAGGHIPWSERSGALPQQNAPMPGAAHLDE